MRLILLIVLLPAVTLADDCRGNCPGGSTDTAVEVMTDVDSSVNNVISGDSSKAFAFGHGLGDVDIAQCLGSTQWDTILGGKQKLVLNNVCMAEFYLNQGKYALAAMALCNQPEILKEFSTEEECEGAHDFTPPPMEPTIIPMINEEQMVIVEEQEEEIESLEQRIARIEQANRIAARKAQERREFAQETLLKVTENDSED